MRLTKEFIDHVFILAVLIFFPSCSSTTHFVHTSTWKDEFRHKGAPDTQMWVRSVTKPGEQLSAYRDEDANAYIMGGKSLRPCLQVPSLLLPSAFSVGSSLCARIGFPVKTIPLIVEAYSAFAIHVLHPTCKAQHGCMVIGLLTTVMRSLAVMPHILTFSSEGVCIDKSIFCNEL